MNTKNEVKKYRFFNKEKLSRIFVIIFISVWMFILGVFVGRKNAPVHIVPSKLEQEIAFLKKEAAEKERADEDKLDNDFSKAEQKYDFYDYLRSGENDGQKSKVKEPAKKEIPIEALAVTLQAAAFKDKRDADKVAEYLKKEGYNVFIIKADVNNTVWYRIRIRILKSDLPDTLKALKEKKFSPFVIYEAKE